MEKVTRVEVIDKRGRVYSNWKCKKVDLSYQDDGRTLKIFIDDEEYKRRLPEDDLLAKDSHNSQGEGYVDAISTLPSGDVASTLVVHLNQEESSQL